MTARQILQDTYTARNENFWPKTIVLGEMAMEQYARQEAIAFAEWKDTHYKRTSGGSYYGILPQMSRFENPIRYLSLKDVYDKYLEHITMLNKKV